MQNSDRSTIPSSLRAANTGDAGLAAATHRWTTLGRVRAAALARRYAGGGLGRLRRDDRSYHRHGDRRRDTQCAHHFAAIHSQQRRWRNRAAREQIILVKLVERQPDELFIDRHADFLS